MRMAQTLTPFHLLEATIDDIQRAYTAGDLSARELTQLYLNRIEAYDRTGPRINSMITIAPDALTQADRLDAALSASGPRGPLHGVPVILKDQMDAAGLPTTLGSILFKDYYPTRDSFVTERLRRAGVIILGKATLGELGSGDTHGTLFGSTRNPWDLERTPGGSSGGPAAAVSANLGAVAVGQEGFASIRRPAAWTGIVGMRPSGGLVSRGGVYAGWPSTNGSLGPMARTVRDLAVLLDVMVDYDPEDPITALGVGRTPSTYTAFLDETSLKGARIGILREPMGHTSEPDSEDFARVGQVFDRAVAELEAAGATVIDPILIPDLRSLLDKRRGSGSADAFAEYVGRGGNPPFTTRQEMLASPDSARVVRQRTPSIREGGTAEYYESLAARETLTINLLKVMADHSLDAIVHKTVEHQPTLIRDAINPPHYNSRGATHLNTYLVYVPSISVPAGFTSEGLPAGITFLGRPYSDGAMIRLAYAYEQATRHRVTPSSTPRLPGEP
ncbi:MAG: amidase [Chloroflexi bacterium]|nr:amidase [Chloroflexota bacterium]